MITGNQLSETEVVRQQAVLAEVRTRHTEELIESGVAARAIGSMALSNKFSIPHPITDSSVLFPFRNRFGDLPSLLTSKLLVDVGLAAPGHDDEFDGSSNTTVSGTEADPTYVLCIGRVDEAPNERESGGYIVGLILAEQISVAAPEYRYRPVPGLERADLEIIQRQLDEITDVAAHHELTLVDPITLAEDPEMTGQM